MFTSLKVLKFLSNFLLTILGVIQKPHAAYLRLEKKGEIRYLVLIWFLGFFSLFLSRAVKYGVFHHPFFFVIRFSTFFWTATFSFLLVVLLIFLLGTFFGGKGNFKAIFLLWGFSYLPTILWFFLASFLYLFFPPPRSLTLQGYLLSGVFVILSTALFYWKLLLYYFTLRIGFKLTWGPIIKISALFFPTVALYSYLLYKLGVFKVPFL